ncbi:MULTISPECIES: UDP-glucose 4-epimerase GalE [unclassified Duganella]|uniref:UDP-glucose 4-epimerase GalE n=1 Tax=unclassified Duganella TaxID=2636909 RepID=UPI00088D250B|nr:MULTISPECIES: UDP-glucose 4-epimerase GalE [unclassified Duganella]SDG43126.1 UDP-glucose 4-epimerase [Duganella sp. OV458]SDJ60891.1 UDP-glucose 4-epimerase [Duganella sp. OV510]
MQKTILVVGGAGYVGSHMVKRLRQHGYLPVVLDNLSQGRREAVGDTPLIVADLHDQAALDVLFQAYPVQAVMHFASYIQVGESVQQPARYYENNVANTLGLLEAMVRHGVDQFIFSSTAAIFGDPQYVPIDERHPALPINPYGKSKLMVEEMLEDFERAYKLRSICLRYFNAAGADPDNELGECHEPETHLIPLVLQAASGRRAAITIYGEDYPTPDGTCLRDYIHVQDLCDAHLLALQALAAGGRSARYNLGNGNGYSIREVIAAAERVTGRRIPVASGPRRDGDPARLVADATRARQELGWQPQFSELDAIIGHAWAWEQRLHPAPPPLRAVPAPEANAQERRQQDRRAAHRAA